MNETIYVAHWEGPEVLDKHEAQAEHVIYALYGAHHLYGRDVLLYIGKAEKGTAKRLPAHYQWTAEEYDPVTVRVASIGKFTTWDDWDEVDRYPRAKPDVVCAVEALLIIAHQPAYNSQGKKWTRLAKGLRVFNTGHLGHLLPEISSSYFLGK